MPENYIQILLLLTTNTAGMTTANLLKESQRARYAGIKDIKAASNLVYNMRNAGLISSSDAIGGKIHKITAKGIAALEAESGAPLRNKDEPEEPQAVPVPEKTQDPENTVIQPSPLSKAIAEVLETPILPVDEPIIPNSTDTLLASFDESIGIIRECIVAAMNTPEPQIKIRDKTRKIAALEQLENIPFFTHDVVDILIAIRADLQQMEAE